MGKIWEFFDTLSEYVYVADMDTHDGIKSVWCVFP